jgi:hypothetical protein
MEPLDGNAIAGLLYEVFGEEMTAAMATCATCEAVASVAETLVYPRLPGEVVRCRTCGGLMMVITQIRGMNCVGLPGIAALNLRGGRSGLARLPGGPCMHGPRRGPAHSAPRPRGICALRASYHA